VGILQGENCYGPGRERKDSLTALRVMQRRPSYAMPAPVMESNRTSRDIPPVEMRLTCVTYAADRTSLFEFRPLGGQPVAPFEAGAHIDVHLPNGMVRQYSLINRQSETHRYVVGIKRDPRSRGGSSYIFEKLMVGTVLKIGAPRNNFRLLENASHSVLVAGGIGITPIWAMLHRLESMGRSWELHYATRSRSETAFSAELEQFGDRVHLHVDDEYGGVVMDIGAALRGVASDAHLYCCGPTPMLASFEEATRSFPRGQVHVERFTSDTPVASAGGYLVELARCGKVVKVGNGQTILEALRANGVNVASSCEQGICGACETKVVSGIPDHRDMILSAEEQAANATMMICCSGSKSDVLVLDL
jgi:tetrachlorobenzoquinone reductase